MLNFFYFMKSSEILKMCFNGKSRILLLSFFLLCYTSTSEVLSEELVSVALKNTNMTRLTARAIHEVGYHLHRVEHLTIYGAPQLEHIVVEDLAKMPNLKTLYISQAPLLHKVGALPPMPELRSFIITTSGLVEVPNLSHVHDYSKSSSSMPLLQIVDLEANHIKKLSPHALRIRADHVSLNYNLLEEVPPLSFKSAQIAKLSFKGNGKLKTLNEDSFAGNLLIRQLDLSLTAISWLPTKGLEKLEVLKIEKTPTLKYIPSIYDLQHLEKASLTHHFHCCAFAFPERHDRVRHALYEMQIQIMAQKCGHNQENSAKARRRRSLEPIMMRKHHMEKGLVENAEGWESISEDPSTSEEYDPSNQEDYNFSSYEDDDLENFHSLVENPTHNGSVVAECGNFSISHRKVECTPLPNALNPCEDVMGWTWLRASVWVVITAATIGNLAVLIVLVTNRSEMTVPRFLMCHLAFSDLCTGIYLFMVAVVDLQSYGEFFNYAYDWQYGVGCKIAGFLSVFSGQLSVFTLTIVTLERWFAITYAIYLESRISIAMAAKIMVGGWVFSLLMAGLPLFGVSDYSSTSICLPVESANIGDAVYQGCIFLTSIIAWITIVTCYVQIYRSLGGGGAHYGGRAAAAAAERRIANKMALLIGTDLLCWAPVAFFGVTALAGVPLVDVSHGKVLLVFFYPLNACANPFLYAILTKQYRRDLIMLIARSGQCTWVVEKYKLATTPPPTAQTHPSAPAPLTPLVDYEKSQSQISKENGELLL